MSKTSEEELSGEIREDLAEILLNYDRSRMTPTGNAVDIEVTAVDGIIAVILKHFVPKEEVERAYAAGYRKATGHVRLHIEALAGGPAVDGYEHRYDQLTMLIEKLRFELAHLTNNQPNPEGEK